MVVPLAATHGLEQGGEGGSVESRDEIERRKSVDLLGGVAEVFARAVVDVAELQVRNRDVDSLRLPPMVLPRRLAPPPRDASGDVGDGLPAPAKRPDLRGSGRRILEPCACRGRTSVVSRRSVLAERVSGAVGRWRGGAEGDLPAETAPHLAASSGEANLCGAVGAADAEVAIDDQVASRAASRSIASRGCAASCASVSRRPAVSVAGGAGSGAGGRRGDDQGDVEKEKTRPKRSCGASGPGRSQSSASGTARTAAVDRCTSRRKWSEDDGASEGAVG
jgi:hypothetical protein